MYNDRRIDVQYVDGLVEVEHEHLFNIPVEWIYENSQLFTGAEYDTKTMLVGKKVTRLKCEKCDKEIERQ